MITMDSLMAQLRNLYVIGGQIRFDTPEYVRFVTELRSFIYENHFDGS